MQRPETSLQQANRRAVPTVFTVLAGSPWDGTGVCPLKEKKRLLTSHYPLFSFFFFEKTI